ncbi:MAG TPA: DUF2460 domain-containing protein [Bryobacteraceae bacterium]|jgi:hypothetical protein|nr:DUF2460 domain-containing protein [Bryobacteraceae bacterium]
MATFPTLKTGAVAQYPASKSLRFQNQVLRFLDGTSQRYRDSAGMLHSWDILLSQMDEQEMAEIEQFFVDNQGCFANFTFTDPWDSQVYPSCSIANDGLGLTFAGELRGAARLRIVENRA